ncbi:Gfo/Idh/MocA family protein [Paenibacillus marinisediminis]
MKLGIVGLDTSHSVAFTELLNNPSNPNHIPGGQIVIASPGISSSIPVSSTRAEGYMRTLQDDYGIPITESLEQVAHESDAILLTSADGELHEAQLQKLAPYGKPIYIDKPFALSVDVAARMIHTANQYHIPLMSSSALRYTDVLVEALNSSTDPIDSVDVYGPIPSMDGVPGWFWYGIHSVELMHAVMGAGCSTVQATPTPDGAHVLIRWEDGRCASIRGLLNGSSFGAVIHRHMASQQVDISTMRKPFYASLLEQVVTMFQTGQTPLPVSHTLEVIGCLEAIHESLRTGQPAHIAKP